MVYQTFWSRVAARLIDAVLLIPLFILEAQYDPLPVWLLVTILVVEHAYFIIGHAQYGQTLGKRILGVRVVRAHQHLPIGWSHAIMRELLLIAVGIFVYATNKSPFYVYAVSFALAVLVGDIVLAWIHPHHRSLRDFIARTVVIRTENN